MNDASEVVERLAAALALLNPSAVLERGYAIALDDAGAVLTDASLTKVGATVTTRLARGALQSTVVQIIPPDANPKP